MSASLAPECNDVKERYDTCFLKWYSEKFLRGDTSADGCTPVFEKYMGCLSKALKAKGIEPMIEEARKSNEDERRVLVDVGGG